MMGESSDALNVSPTWPVAESTESTMRTETFVPEGTAICRVAGSTGSGFTSLTSGGATGASIGGGAGAGNVNVGEGADAAGAVTTAGASFLATCSVWADWEGTFAFCTFRGAATAGSSDGARSFEGTEYRLGSSRVTLSLSVEASTAVRLWELVVGAEHPANTSTEHKKNAAKKLRE